MNTFGHHFRVTTFGESHGPGVGAVIDGCPGGVAIDLERVAAQLARRRPGAHPLATQRREPDRPEVLSGLQDGITLGSPLTLWVPNRDVEAAAYDRLDGAFRPSHGDFTYWSKYGVRARSGGGRASARETVGRVAAGAVAQQLLEKRWTEFAGAVAYVAQIGDEVAPLGEGDDAGLTSEAVDRALLRCPDPETAARMEAAVAAAQRAGDSLGGVVAVRIEGCSVGMGSPVFHKLEAELARAMLSIPATKGFEIGSGFRAASMRGSEHNDAWYADAEGRPRTRSNRSGGVQAGISNGEAITFRVAFKPVATIRQPQETLAEDGSARTIGVATERHDPCVVPRAVPIVEAMAHLVLMDQLCAHGVQELWR